MASNFHTAVCVSLVPTSVNDPLNVTGVFTANADPLMGPVIVTTGATLSTWTIAASESVASAPPRSSSVAVTATTFVSV